MSTEQTPRETAAVVRLWDSRFSGGPSEAMHRLSVSTHFDWVLAPYDLQQSSAHAKVLHAADLLTDQELERMLAGIEELQTRVADGTFAPTPEDEDVHTALERGLLEILGNELGGKLRAGRSRNDQVATDFRLYLQANIALLKSEILDLVDAFVGQAEIHVDDVAPGYTHLQRAQPVSFGHELAKHAHALLRDVERLEGANGRISRSPMGAGALAGSSLPLNPEMVAADLGFDSVLENSIDAVSDRDFAAEFLFATAMLGVHLSRIGEEICLWSSVEFGWARLDDGFATGSSIMPQKKNPDSAELARGKAGRLIGNLTGLLATLKGLPFAYNRDLQEDKEPVFDTVQQLEVLLPALTGTVATLEFNTVAMAEVADGGFALATDIAEWLVRNGVPFREAHGAAGSCVKFAEADGIELIELSDAQLQEAHPALTPAVREVLTVAGSVGSRSATGGTAPSQVKQQLARLRRQVADWREAAA